MAKQYDWNFLKSVGKRIAALRKQKGMSQETLASKTDLHRTYVGYIEQGKRDPSIGNLHKITRALDTTIEELFADFAVVAEEPPTKQ